MHISHVYLRVDLLKCADMNNSRLIVITIGWILILERRVLNCVLFFFLKRIKLDNLFVFVEVRL